MRTPTRLLLAGIAAGAMVTGFGPAAVASGSDTINGGCFYDTEPEVPVPGGVIGDASVTQDPSGQPTDATVSCQIKVNGVVAPGTTFSYSGFGVQDGVDRTSFGADGTEEVDLCERVVYADGTDTGWTCTGPCTCNFPPQPVIDALNTVIEAFNDVVNPQVCQVLVAGAGTYGPVTIAPDGDVYVEDPLGTGLFEPLYDCPPYNNF